MKITGKSMVMNGVEMESMTNVKDGSNVVWLSQGDLQGKVTVLGHEFPSIWAAFDYGVAGRNDDERLKLNWMLYVLWKRCGNDVEFWVRVGRLHDKIVVFKGNTDAGCRNNEMERQRRAIRTAIEAKYEGKTDAESHEAMKRELEWELGNLACGEWSGKNKMGKLLTMCNEGIKTKTAPRIDFDYFDEVGINWFGKRLKFLKKNTAMVG